eukprot:476426_1
MSTESKSRFSWRLFSPNSDNTDPVQCYKSTPAKYLQKFGFIENGHCINNDTSTDPMDNKNKEQPLKFDHRIFIDNERCFKSKKCYDLIQSNTFTDTTNLINVLKQNGCLSCLNIN